MRSTIKSATCSRASIEQPAGHRSLAEAKQDRDSAGLQAAQRVLPVRALLLQQGVEPFKHSSSSPSQRWFGDPYSELEPISVLQLRLRPRFLFPLTRSLSGAEVEFAKNLIQASGASNHPTAIGRSYFRTRRQIGESAPTPFSQEVGDILLKTLFGPSRRISQFLPARTPS